MYRYLVNNARQELDIDACRTYGLTNDKKNRGYRLATVVVNLY
jgi:hypothetical protein